MNTSYSVKANATAFIEGLAATSETAFDIVAAMEDNFRREHLVPVDRVSTREQIIARVPLTEVIAGNVTMATMAEELAAFHERRKLADAKWVQKTRLMSHFGRWLQKDEVKLANAAKEGLESMEDRMAVLPYIVGKIQSRKEWKAEQNRSQDPEGYTDETLNYELPPRTNGRSHQPAYYRITGPSGTTIDLSEEHKGWKPVLSANPNSAFRRFLSRMNVEMDGGEVEILNRLLKTKPIELENQNGEVVRHYVWLPSYVSHKIDGVWFVTVGWHRNPSAATSRYWLDANEELTQQDPGDGSSPLTLSQLDYHLLCESSDLAMENEDGEVVEFMNEEEEFITMFPQRDTDETFLDAAKYCEDDEELELINACKSVVERSEGGVTEGDLQSQQFVDDYIGKGIVRAEQTINKLQNQLADGNGDALTEEILENMTKHLARLNRLNDQWNRFVGGSETLVRYDNCEVAFENVYHIPFQPTTYGCTRENAMREPVKVLPCMTVMPDNTIEAPLAREAGSMIAHRTVNVSLADAKQLRRQKQVCASIIHGRFGMLVREKTAQDTFAEALDSALRA
jgi:hypothetical protein